MNSNDYIPRPDFELPLIRALQPSCLKVTKVKSASEMISVSLDLLDPLIEQLPDETIGSLWIARILVIFNMLLLCLVTGLLIRIKFGMYLKGSMEKFLLNRLPGYTIIKSLTHRFSGSVDGMDFAPAILSVFYISTPFFFAHVW